jgi:hypothetical protein
MARAIISETAKNDYYGSINNGELEIMAPAIYFEAKKHKIWQPYFSRK